MGYPRTTKTPRIRARLTSLLRASGTSPAAPRRPRVANRRVQLDVATRGSDIVYTARVPVPKIIAISAHIGTRFPATATSMGRVLLAHLDAVELDDALAQAVDIGRDPPRRALPVRVRRFPGGIRGGAGPSRTSSVVGHPFDRRSAVRPLRTNGGGDERHCACRRDVDRPASSTSISRAPEDRRSDVSSPWTCTWPLPTLLPATPPVSRSRARQLTGRSTDQPCCCWCGRR